MAGRITNFFRELVFPFSIILTILGLIVLIIGITGNWAQDIAKDMFNFSDDILNWWLYFLIIGFIIFATGIWYLYSYLKNRKFILDELETNKRSELLKKHAELENTVKHMPSKYQKMLKAKEEELKIR
jgi:type VI protein secretion system component VasK